jgi:catechol 2,3-dioxygenase-like lactoylglutathione lyase family enzyme
MYALVGVSRRLDHIAEVIMRDLTAIEIKAFVPAKDFELSKRFYQDLGFTVAWSSEGLAYIRHGNTSFLLQEFPDGIDNFMMHLLVQDVDAWWSNVQDQDIVAKYGVMIEPLSDKPWGLRDFAISDPSHVLWRIGQNIAR